MGTIRPPSASSSLPGQHQLTLPEVVYHMRSGRTVVGEPVRPYKWLDYAGGQRTPMELKVARVMESCSFKSALSCVLGEWVCKEIGWRVARRVECHYSAFLCVFLRTTTL